MKTISTVKLIMEYDDMGISKKDNDEVKKYKLLDSYLCKYDGCGNIIFKSSNGYEEHWEYDGYGRLVKYEKVLDISTTPNIIEIPETGIGDVSDGYHTFNELYHHRAILFSVICNSMSHKAWKSKLHDTGDMYDGMFIVGIETPKGQATYHYDIDPYWELFRVKELDRAPKWDGHTPEDAIKRIEELSYEYINEDNTAIWKLNKDGSGTCTRCGITAKNVWDYDNYQNYCGSCGSKMSI